MSLREQHPNLFKICLINFSHADYAIQYNPYNRQPTIEYVLEVDDDYLQSIDIDRHQIKLEPTEMGFCWIPTRESDRLDIAQERLLRDNRCPGAYRFNNLERFLTRVASSNCRCILPFPESSETLELNGVVYESWSPQLLSYRDLKKTWKGDETCINNAHSIHLQCAVNPEGDCKSCKDYEKSPSSFSND